MENNRGINHKGYGRPTILALSRQGVPNLPGTSKEGVAKGGYVVHGGDGKPDAIIMATGESHFPALHCCLCSCTTTTGESYIPALQLCLCSCIMAT